MGLFGYTLVKESDRQTDIEKAYKKPIKYFLAAEYGDKTKRPHYHAIVFGLKPPDAQWYKNQKGNSYFKSIS